MTVHGGVGETMRKSVQHVQRAGKGGDTRLAHVNPREQRMLKASGGSGNINPKTGLKSFENHRDSKFVQVSGSGEAGGTVRRTPSIAARSEPSPQAQTTFTPQQRAFLSPFLAPKPAPKPDPKPDPKLDPKPDPTPTPIGQSFIGAINRSSGNTGIQTISRSAVKRAARAGVKEKDIVVNVDESGL